MPWEVIDSIYFPCVCPCDSVTPAARVLHVVDYTPVMVSARSYNRPPVTEAVGMAARLGCERGDAVAIGNQRFATVVGVRCRGPFIYSLDTSSTFCDQITRFVWSGSRHRFLEFHGMLNTLHKDFFERSARVSLPTKTSPSRRRWVPGVGVNSVTSLSSATGGGGTAGGSEHGRLWRLRGCRVVCGVSGAEHVLRGRCTFSQVGPRSRTQTRAGTLVGPSSSSLAPRRARCASRDW